MIYFSETSINGRIDGQKLMHSTPIHLQYYSMVVFLLIALQLHDQIGPFGRKRRTVFTQPNQHNKEAKDEFFRKRLIILIDNMVSIWIICV